MWASTGVSAMSYRLLHFCGRGGCCVFAGVGLMVLSG